MLRNSGVKLILRNGTYLGVPAVGVTATYCKCLKTRRHVVNPKKTAMYDKCVEITSTNEFIAVFKIVIFHLQCHMSTVTTGDSISVWTPHPYLPLDPYYNPEKNNATL
jgi:amino acid permease